MLLFLIFCGEGVHESSRHDYAGEKRARKQRAAGFFHQQDQLDNAKADTAQFFRENNTGVTLFGKLGPQFRIKCGVGLHKTTDFRDGALAREEFTGAVAKEFLVFIQSKLHGKILNNFVADRGRSAR